ncbi:beta-galactosidase 15-like [Corylus avellana]|uniref:beta-galactosidase 15-like n=1 Tax=Corylus avellana TaxID=13451 RepID=UPI001E20FC07|nr:beta-galactosidase 15-like [Corylus avellana]
MASSIFLLISAFFLFITLPSFALNVSHDGRAITIDGERRILLSGSIHYPRSTPGMWPSLIKKAKEGGLNTIETYVFWNAHEAQRRQYDFSGNLDLVRFLKTVQDEGLYAVLRIGPYVCAEWNYGGFPVWLHNIPGIKFRTKNDVFMNEMSNFTTVIVDMMKHENLFASQGGPIIISQIENEYGNVIGSYGNDGKEYVQWCANLAQSYQTGVPWVMCQQSDAPSPMINTCNGWYCDQFTPNNPNSPKMWTENWTGWYKGWGLQDPHRTVEDLAYAVARFFQYGGTFQNYYMYHGGTNFGRTSGGPYITTSYDYDAPLDEYGNLNQPKWGHLKQLHLLLRSMEKVLTHGSVRSIEYGNMTTATIYSYEGKSSCFFGNGNAENDATINFENTMYTVPAWSVSILPDCFTEVYNTAKVNSQTSVMVKKGNAADDFEEPYVLKWQWRDEGFEHSNKNGLVEDSLMTVEQLLEQKAVTNDTSDYLWYITSFNVKNNDPILGKDTTLQVNTAGHIIHAFVNGRHVGSQYAQNGKYNFTFERKIKLNIGRNEIALLSVTVGLPNYGGNFDLVQTGISGPVNVVGRERLDDLTQKLGDEKYIIQEVTKELAFNKWTYKIGLRGERQQLHDPVHSHRWRWFGDNLPTSKMFVWYKTTFKAPTGSDPVVVDLMGLGKGHAWVNGHSIGRYWLSYLASEDGCSSTCDYRGTYSNSKCMTNCGKPSQRWYHVPRDFLNADDNNNTLVVFEEFGGNPWNVKFQTVTVGSACANAYEGNTLELSCQGGNVVSQIRFASFGSPNGACGSFGAGQCESPSALSTIQKACIGKERCSIDVSESYLGPTGCKETNRLAVEIIC